MNTAKPALANETPALAPSRMVIPAASRGIGRADWLTSYHSFSFADYYDPARMGFGHLRVINDDTIAGGGGFPQHPHRDMEIVTLVFEGALAHKDSLGNASQIRAGDVQRMSAGTGIRHSEFNASASEPVHLYQIWILPDAKNITPSYEQKAFTPDTLKNKWTLVGSRTGREGSISYHQDIDIYRASLEPEKTIDMQLQPTRIYWLQVVSGAVNIDGQTLQTGDAFALAGEQARLTLSGIKGTELILFDQPVLTPENGV